MRTKIKEIKVYDKTNKDGTKSAGVTFEDIVFGFYNFKGELSLKAGDEVDYTAEEHEKKDKSGKYKTLTITKVGETPKAEPPKADKPKIVITIDKLVIFQEKCKANIESMKMVMDHVSRDKLNFDKVKDTHKEINTYLFDAVDEISQE